MTNKEDELKEEISKLVNPKTDVLKEPVNDFWKTNSKIFLLKAELKGYLQGFKDGVENAKKH
jgi:hypothetical protein